MVPGARNEKFYVIPRWREEDKPFGVQVRD